MSNENYKTVRVYNETYDKLREIKYISKENFVDILKKSIDETHKEIIRKENLKAKNNNRKD